MFFREFIPKKASYRDKMGQTKCFSANLSRKKQATGTKWDKPNVFSANLSPKKPATGAKWDKPNVFSTDLSPKKQAARTKWDKSNDFSANLSKKAYREDKIEQDKCICYGNCCISPPHEKQSPQCFHENNAPSPEFSS